MITLNSQADKIANLLKQPDNHELKERIKESFKNLMATYIRQDFEKHGIDERLILPFDVELEDVTYPEYKSVSESHGKSMKRSKYKIPTPIRFKHSAPYVSVEDSNNTYTFVHPRELHKSNLYLSLGESLYYFVENSYLYCGSSDETTNIKIGVIRVLAPYENPEEVLDYYNTESDFQDTILPFPRDMISRLTVELLKSEFGVVPTPEEINVKLDERPE